MIDTDLTERRVLLVEDDYLLAKPLEELFEGRGATILGPAATTKKALALLAQNARVDAAVVDINLGGTMSFAVADALLALAVPFVFTTGYTASIIPERFRDAAVIQKPARPMDILDALTALMG
jgi:CheY-like chemotaxis protein